MYIPPAFKIDDSSKLATFIRRYSFATLITDDGAAPFASHLPMLYLPDAGPHGALVSHMAKANPQWQHFTPHREVLTVFNGPHTYISPSWYHTAPAVPTWNYAAVHAYGVPRIFTEPERVLSLLRDTIATYEAAFEQPWSGDLPADYVDKLARGIVAFEIPLSRIEAKFKLSQNRPAADVQGVFNALSKSDDAESRAVAEMMAAECSIQRGT